MKLKIPNNETAPKNGYIDCPSKYCHYCSYGKCQECASCSSENYNSDIPPSNFEICKDLKEKFKTIEALDEHRKLGNELSKYRSRYEDLKKKTSWISVKDKLPMIGNEYVLVCIEMFDTGEKFVDIEHLSEHSPPSLFEGYCPLGTSGFRKITHWMWLPKPYEGEKDASSL